jgi:hypothetical protein
MKAHVISYKIGLLKICLLNRGGSESMSEGQYSTRELALNRLPALEPPEGSSGPHCCA